MRGNIVVRYRNAGSLQRRCRNKVSTKRDAGEGHNRRKPSSCRGRRVAAVLGRCRGAARRAAPLRAVVRQGQAGFRAGFGGSGGVGGSGSGESGDFGGLGEAGGLGDLGDSDDAVALSTGSRTMRVRFGGFRKKTLRDGSSFCFPPF